MKILILGNEGLLGNCVEKYFRKIDWAVVLVTKLRWPDEDFISFVKEEKFDWIINCIAKIPQSNDKSINGYFVVNFGLPVFLASIGTKLIHASSNIEDDSLYSMSKVMCDKVLANFDNVYTIKCSIIGIEKNNNRSLLSKFLNTKEESWVGYSNYMWNGITTLEWANIAHSIIIGENKNKLITPYSTEISKYNLLVEFCKIFGKDIIIKPAELPVINTQYINNGLFCGSIEKMLLDLKNFYNGK